MMTEPKTNAELLQENERLSLRLEEAEAVVEAIRNGIVDAVVVRFELATFEIKGPTGAAPAVVRLYRGE